MLLPLYKSEENILKDKTTHVLAGDVGATKTNLAFFRMEGRNMILLNEAQFKSNAYRDFIEMVDAFARDIHPIPDSVCFGVAGPVLNGHAKLSNIDWEIDSAELSSHFKIKNVHLINDLEATAYGLEMLNETDVAVIHKGDEATACGNAAVIAPGTGLGEAGLYWDGIYYHPFATEGGHSDFAPRTGFDFELYSFLKKKFGHVSWERLVCGPGIVNIYQFLRDEKKREEPGWLKEEIIKGDAAAVISRYESESEICKETMHFFIRFLAYESANLVLKLKATGGLFIGGGIAPQIVPLFEKNDFHTSFCQSGRLNYLLKKVPVKIILNPKTALLGTAFYGSENYTTAK